MEKKNNSDLIELHNRPIYLNYLKKELNNKTYLLYFHNDPLTMSGSKTVYERIFLLKSCFKIIFNSNWSKRRFLEGMKSDYINSEKLIVINQSAQKSPPQYFNQLSDIWIKLIMFTIRLSRLDPRY